MEISKLSLKEIIESFSDLYLEWLFEKLHQVNILTKPTPGTPAFIAIGIWVLKEDENNREMHPNAYTMTDRREQK